MSLSILNKLFSGSARVKMLRLFLSNSDTAFDVEAILNRSKISRPTLRKEIKILTDIGFLQMRTRLLPESKPAKKVTIKKKSKVVRGKPKKKITAPARRSISTWMVNQRFILLPQLKSLLVDSELVQGKELAARFATAGSIKMLVLSGIFMRDTDKSVDMIIVGDKLDMKKMNSVLTTLESEVGKELRYSIFTPDEFAYRLKMYDQHLLEIFDAPHDRVVDKLGLVA